jgi:hypothetical protein
MPNKEYTCHNCEHVYETWPDNAKEHYNAMSRAEPGTDVFPATACMKCPNCEETYYINLQGDPPTLIT